MTATEASSSGNRVDPRVVVAILTYLRPQDVRDAVTAVIAHADGHGGATSVLVVDNDPGASAMPLQEAFPPERVRFVHEPTPGIAAARNRALDEAGDADVLIFLDDDERPEPGWLEHMLDTWRRFDASAVKGRVVAEFPSEPSPWITAGERLNPRWGVPTGAEITESGTGNLLLDLGEVRRVGVRFDERFSASGGSDTLFTRQLHTRGGRLVWCNEATVKEMLPTARITRRWALRRAFRYGNTWSRVALVLAERPAARFAQRVAMTAKGAARFIVGVGQFLFGLVTVSIEDRVCGARRVARGLGLVAGAWGGIYTEYQRPS